MRLLRSLVLLLLAAAAAAQPSLSVNGRDVPGLTLSLVSGVSYAPAGPYAEALGADLRVDYGSGRISLELGGRLLVLPSFSAPGEAGEGVTIQVNGEGRPGRGAVFSDGQLFLPVSTVAEGFLGYTTYVAERERVMVVTPRGRISDMRLQRQGGADRLVISLVANVPYTHYYNEPVNTLELRFDRTDAGSLPAIEDARHFSRAVQLSSSGGTEVRVSLEENVGYSLYTVPEGRGYRLVVDLFERADMPAEAVVAPRVVLDAAHGGEDDGMAVGEDGESELTLDLARRLARLLEEHGLRVESSRTGDHSVPLASRSSMGVGSDLFLSLHVHPSPNGATSIYYLSEADGAASLELAVRQNAELELQGTTDALRRRLLLNLIPDIEVGRRYALAIHGELFARSGVRVEDPEPAPLAVLAGAAGRGLLLELSPEQASDDALVEVLAEVVAGLLLGSEPRR